MFSTLKSLVLHLFVIGCVAVSGTLSHAAPSEYCALLLSPKEVKELRESIERQIATRTSLIREGNPFLVDGETGVPIDVLEGLNRGMAKPIFDATTKTMIIKVDNLISKWVLAVREQIKSQYEDFRAQAQEVEARRRAIKASGRQLGPTDEPRVPMIENDADGLPVRPLVQAARDLDAVLIKNGAANPIKIDLAMRVRQTIPGKPGPAEIESRLAQVLIEGRKFKEPDGSEIVFRGLKQRFADRIKAKAADVVEAAETKLAETYGKESPDWNGVIHEAMPIFAELVLALEMDFPIEDAVAKGKPAAIDAKQFGVSAIAPPVITAKVDQYGVPEITIEDIGVRAYFPSELGAPVLESNRGLLANPDGIVVVQHHGDGTVVSDAFSWKYTIARFVANGVNPVAPGLPMAGIGMRITGLYDTTMYVDLTGRWVRDEVRKKGGARLPLVHMGRSMGSQKGYAHALLFESADNPFDAYVETSLSNPYTSEAQNESVLEQVRTGLVKGLMPESLDNASKLSDELAATIGDLKRKWPKAFRVFGDKMLMLQGDGDRDGGATVVEDLIRFRDEAAPLSHIYTFENRLKKYPEIDLSKIPDAGLEGVHILFSNQSNMSKEAAARKFPGVAPEDLPALQDQFFEAMAVQMGFFDYLAESTSTLPEMVRARGRFQEYRMRLCGRDAGGRPRTFIDWIRAKAQISERDFAAAEPGRKNLASRLKRVTEYWKAERIRVAGLYAKARQTEIAESIEALYDARTSFKTKARRR